MMNDEMITLFTSESVSEGHPDKICDQISDAVLDEALKQDKNSRVAIECLVTTEKVVIGGEVRTTASIDYEKIARSVLKEIGYNHKDIGIGYDTCDVEVLVHEQSPDIAMGVDETDGKEMGAGDQGIMFGFACSETKQLMPLPIMISHRLVKRASELRKAGVLSWARPDMKSQVTIDYTNKQQPKIHTILMSVQHVEHTPQAKIKEDLLKTVILPVVRSFELNTDFNILINPTGKFVIGGPHGDCGLTGRKIIVDTYGGYSRHGGGAFSGKDATKVDRSGAYMARWLAKNIVSAGLCEKCEIQLSFAIGEPQPISINLDTFGTEVIPVSSILNVLSKLDLSPRCIIDTLSLNKPIFSQTSAYGHFGKRDLPWEVINTQSKLYQELSRLTTGQPR